MLSVCPLDSQHFCLVTCACRAVLLSKASLAEYLNGISINLSDLAVAGCGCFGRGR